MDLNAEDIPCCRQLSSIKQDAVVDLFFSF